MTSNTQDNKSNSKLTSAQSQFLLALTELFMEMNSRVTTASNSTTDEVSNNDNNTTIIKSNDYSEEYGEEINRFIIGKEGNSYIFNDELIKELLDKGWSKIKIANEAKVHPITLNKYLEKKGLVSTIHRESNKGNSSSNHNSNKVSPTRYHSHNQVCPVCNKEFTPAPQHIYKNKLGAKVCSYTCARRSGGM